MGRWTLCEESFTWCSNLHSPESLLEQESWTAEGHDLVLLFNQKYSSSTNLGLYLGGDLRWQDIYQLIQLFSAILLPWISSIVNKWSNNADPPVRIWNKIHRMERPFFSFILSFIVIFFSKIYNRQREPIHSERANRSLLASSSCLGRLDSWSVCLIIYPDIIADG